MRPLRRRCFLGCGRNGYRDGWRWEGGAGADAEAELVAVAVAAIGPLARLGDPRVDFVEGGLDLFADELLFGLTGFDGAGHA